MESKNDIIDELYLEANESVLDLLEEDQQLDEKDVELSAYRRKLLEAKLLDENIN